MKSVGEFFDKFRNSALKEIKKRDVIRNAIQTITKNNIEEKDISIKNHTILIKGNSVLKSELFLKKQAIIDFIAKTSTEKIIDIK